MSVREKATDWFWERSEVIEDNMGELFRELILPAVVGIVFLLGAWIATDRVHETALYFMAMGVFLYGAVVFCMKCLTLRSDAQR